MERDFQIPLNVDIQAANKMAKNVASGNGTKHMDIKYHLIRKLLEDKKVSTTCCSTTDMIADNLTKPLSKTCFKNLGDCFAFTERFDSIAVKWSADKQYNTDLLSTKKEQN